MGNQIGSVERWNCWSFITGTVYCKINTGQKVRLLKVCGILLKFCDMKKDRSHLWFACPGLCR